MKEHKRIMTIRARPGQFGTEAKITELNNAIKGRDRITDLHLICDICGKTKDVPLEWGIKGAEEFDRHDCKPKKEWPEEEKRPWRVMPNERKASREGRK